MITPEMIEAALFAAGMQDIAETRHRMKAALTAALALHKSAMPGEIAGLIERLHDPYHSRDEALKAAAALRSLAKGASNLAQDGEKGASLGASEGTAMPGEIEELIKRHEKTIDATADNISLKTAAALRSQAVEIEHTERVIRGLNDQLTKEIAATSNFAKNVMRQEERIAQLEAALAKATEHCQIANADREHDAAEIERLETALAAAKAKPLTMPEGLPEGPWRFEDRRDSTWLDVFRVMAPDGTCVALVREEACARAIASLPDLYADLAAARNKTIEEWTPEWRHKKRGTEYKMVGAADLQAANPIREGTRLIIYEGHDGRWWARSTEEFHDGRFEALATVGKIANVDIDTRNFANYRVEIFLEDSKP